MIYYLEAETGVWLYPLMEITGLVCQLASLAARSLYLLIAGFIILLFGALMDRDIALLAADALAISGLYALFFNKT